MARMGDEVLARGADHLVTRAADGRVTVLAWAPADVTGGGPASGHTVRLAIPVDPAARSVFVLRSSVSEEMGNAWAAWRELGCPASPTARQVDVLRETAEPVRRHQNLAVWGGRVDLVLTLDRHEVTLAEISAVADETPPWLDLGDRRRLLGLPAAVSGAREGSR
jgi:xylan 1,4-beta-xylosidase